jgi:uncharacterized DUF497 family protein
MAFEFDPKKAATNLRKHGVSLADAEPVFYDDQALTREDSEGALCDGWQRCTGADSDGCAGPNAARRSA